ncbi:RluA family pseudouridine synthase [Candidatus Omnitrophota bacterium]
MEELKFTVDARRTGKRLDTFLADIIQRKLSRTFIKKLIDDECVTVNGEQENAHYKVAEGDNIKVTVPDIKKSELAPEDIPIDIVYEDENIAVINKQPGILVHPAGPELTGTLVNALLYRCGNLSGIGGTARPGIVHRLDKDTSGLLVVAKNDAAHKGLSDQFRDRSIKRKYIALVRGIVQLDNGRIDLPIARRKKDVTKMGVSFADEKKKEAVTNYTVLKRFEDFTMLEISLETGRTHQIRVHLAHIGHPVVGDRTYGSGRGLGRQALHAKTLGFLHPVKKELTEFSSDIPEDMQGLIDRGKI